MAEIIKNTDLQVLTPTGWSDFSGLLIKKSSKLLRFILSDGTEVEVTPDHKFGNDIRASDLFPDDEVVTQTGLKMIEDIQELTGDFEVADLLNVNGSVYFTNSVLSHNCSFEKSGNTVLDPDTIEWYEKTPEMIVEPRTKEMFDRNLWVWKDFEVGKNYIISADVARGDAGDYSAAHVICSEDMEQVAEYKGKLPPANFGDLLLELGKRYGNAMVICENNMIGFATIQRLLDASYPRLYWSKKIEGQLFFDPLNWHMPAADKIPGFQTTGKNRPLVINTFEESFRTKLIKIHSARLLDEIKGFIWVNTGMQIRAQAAERMNDDLVMSLSIGLFARNTTLRLANSDTAQVDAMLNSISVERGRHSISAASIQQEVTRNDIARNPYKINGEDFSWLVG